MGSSVNTVTPEDSEIFQTHRIIRKKIIKKIVIIDGKPVELEEVVDEPLSTTDTESQDYQTEETMNTHNIIKKKIIKKILIVDGKPVEVEDIFESPLTADSEPQASEKMKEKNKKQNLASFNLPISDHANDFMEVIEGGG